MHMWYHLLVVLCFVAVFYIAQLSSDVHNDLSWYFCQSWGTRWLVWRTVCRSQKFSLEPQESTNPSKLSGIPKPKPAALSWLKREKRVQGNQRALSYLLLFLWGKHDFILIPLQTRTPSSLILDQNYINTKNQVIKAERRVLKELGFCVHVKHPHKVS